MEFKGTKGEWSVKNDFRSPKIITSTSKDPIAEIKQCFTKRIDNYDVEHSVGQSHNDMMCNAKLMAAAPELLEALQDLTSKNPLHDGYHASKLKALKAIEKALK